MVPLLNATDRTAPHIPDFSALSASSTESGNRPKSPIADAAEAFASSPPPNCALLVT